MIGGTPGGPLLSVSGSLGAMNQALAGLTFTPRLGFVGATDVTVTARDRGQTGLGGPLSGYATVHVEVVAAPDLELQRGQTVVQAGDAAYVVVELSPAGPGPLSATLVARGLHLGEVVERPLVVHSAGQAPAVRLRDGDRTPAYGDAVSLPLSTPGSRVSVTLTVSSAGTAPLAFTGPPRLVGGDACVGVAAPAFEELGPGDETALTATLAVASGPFSCRLEVYTNVPEHDGAFVVELRGYGRGVANGGGCAGGGGGGGPLALALAFISLALLAPRRRTARHAE